MKIYLEPDKVYKRAWKVAKDDAVCTIAVIAALLTMIVNPPSKEYFSFIDYRVIGILFCLMCVVAGLQSLGVLEGICRAIIKKAGDMRRLTLAMMALTFFLAMWLTNDVALIAVVPLVLLSAGSGDEKTLIYILTVITLAANLGSMLTPIGNPQNLYIFSRFSLSLSDFIFTVGPLCMASLVLLVLGALAAKPLPIEDRNFEVQRVKVSGLKVAAYAVLAVLDVLAVLRAIDFWVPLIATAGYFLSVQRNVLRKVDYGLLGTFVAFFIIVGNLRAAGVLQGTIEAAMVVDGALTSIAVSQVISNVPAAILLSQFTQRWQDLLVGTNLGGLGTLVASLASLITFKLYVRRSGSRPVRYIIVFSIMNIFFLGALYAVYKVICRVG